MQAYVIATSTLVEISKVDVSKFDDAYFKSSDKAEKKKGEDAFFEEKSEKKELNADYIDNQKKVSHKICPSRFAESKVLRTMLLRLNASIGGIRSIASGRIA